MKSLNENQSPDFLVLLTNLTELLISTRQSVPRRIQMFEKHR